MTNIDRQFHRIQTRLKAGEIARPERPNFDPELAGLAPISNRERWLAYQAKLLRKEAA